MAEREARKPLLIFGDGLQGEVENFQPNIISEDGLKMVRIEFRPTAELMSFYGLTNDDFTNPQMATFVVDYPKVYVEVLAEGDPEHQCILLVCDFFGRRTRLLERQVSLEETNKLLQKQNTALRYQIGRLMYDLQTSSKNYGEFSKDLLDEVFAPIVKKMRGNISETAPEMMED